MLLAFLHGGARGMLVGGLLFHLASVVDGIDGEIARATVRASPSGAVLDTSVDMATNLLFYLGITTSLTRLHGRIELLPGLWCILCALFGLLMIRFLASRAGNAGSFDIIKVYYRARSLVEPYALLLAAAVAWALGLMNVGLEIGYWCGTVAALCYAVLGARGQLGPLDLATYRPDPRRLAIVLRSSAANTATDLLNALYTRVDLWLVGLMMGSGAAGVYGMARQVAVPIRQVRQSFDGLLIPLVARTLGARGSEGSGEALSSATRLILAIPAADRHSLVRDRSAPAPHIWARFEAAYWPLLALAVAEAIQAAFSIGDLVFVYLRPKLGLYLTLASILIGIVGASLLIPHWGITGAAVSVLAAYTVRAALRSLVLRTRFHLDVPHSRNLGVLLAAAAGIGGVLLARTVPLPVRFDPLPLLAGVGLYAAVLSAWTILARQTLALRGFDSEAG